MGTQDSLDEAGDFVRDTGTTSFLMTWDQSFETWQYYGVRGQPNAILVSSSGEPLLQWAGRLDTEEVLNALTDL